MKIKLTSFIKSPIVIDDEFVVVALTPRGCINTLRNFIIKDGRKVKNAWYNRYTDGNNYRANLLIKWESV
jgi:hypothetical protein